MQPRYISCVLVLLLGGTATAWSQVGVSPPQQPGAPQQPVAPRRTAQIPAAAEQLRPNYVLGPGDIVQIRVPGAEDISERPYRIETSGEITLPLIGAVHAAGLTVSQLQTELTTQLKAYIVNPQVILTLVQFRSDPVFFIGAFQSPGIYPLGGQRTLVEMLTSVGGMAPNASRRLRVSRRKEMGKIPLPSATETADGKGATVEIPLAVLTQEINPPEDIPLMPYDLITAEKAELVYLSGEFNKPGGYELGEKETVGILQLMSLAGGPTPNASLAKARILRPISNTSERAEIPVNLATVLQGKEREMKLLPNDVLYVPRAASGWRTLGRTVLIVTPIIVSILYIVYH